MLVRVFVVILSCFLFTEVQAQPLRDPTQPPAWAAPSQAAAPVSNSGKLQSIVVSDTKRVAIIGGKSYGRGGQVLGSRITRIERDAVWLADGRKLVLFPKLGVQL
ncbi:MSHA biogenesis protein MshK [Ferrimonas sediminum]|uniref:MSHA biogenesis protein MshK n=1 Tax=Ferrimonas sediminum TaxID=718193 RepID=A0A1G8K7R3_9GAMM|nr:MSHA biogenesis protein MshK [Ferrimonas sediminum]SDI39462.1 MSHA biogenesis protein MshK [Ferrimonas sediminum]